MNRDSAETLAPAPYDRLPLLPATTESIATEPLRKVAAWNAEHAPGCAVLVWKQIPLGAWKVVKTIGRAFVWRGRAAVYCADHVRPIFLCNLAPVAPDIVERLELQIPLKPADRKSRGAGE